MPAGVGIQLVFRSRPRHGLRAVLLIFYLARNNAKRGESRARRDQRVTGMGTKVSLHSQDCSLVSVHQRVHSWVTVQHIVSIQNNRSCGERVWRAAAWSRSLAFPCMLDKAFEKLSLRGFRGLTSTGVGSVSS
ncbi:hypothetical protein FA13DRAFT_287224 [Coprinellus micaceus]|uniref:Uncharacterized protein n=1 Tax=Coprinellus micaceus TaxID=71717 RepID=A0A4Y7TF28_COPMI|nr:hypothetical protein FA13DRAFT_287224 [Coprinellus micaceus]